MAPRRGGGRGMRKCKKCGQEIKGKWSLPLCPDCYMEQIIEEWEKLKEAEK